MSSAAPKGPIGAFNDVPSPSRLFVICSWLLVAIVALSIEYFQTDNNLNHTKVFVTTTNKSHLYDERTFGINIYENPCEIVMFDYEFHDFVNAKVPCIGRCINEKFSHCHTFEN